MCYKVNDGKTFKNLVLLYIILHLNGQQAFKSINQSVHSQDHPKTTKLKQLGIFLATNNKKQL